MKMLPQKVICCGDYRSYVVLSESIDRLNQLSPDLPPIKHRLGSGVTEPHSEGLRYVEIVAHSLARLVHLEDYLTELSQAAQKMDDIFAGKKSEEEEDQVSGFENAFDTLFGLLNGKTQPPTKEVNSSDDNH